MDVDTTEINDFIKQYWADRFSYPLDFGDVISNFGSDNIIFSSENEKYVFRIIYSHPDKIHNSSQVYEQLREEGLPVPFPIKTDSDEYVVDAYDEEREDMIGYSIHSYVKGIEDIDGYKLENIIEELATIFGRLHTTLHNMEPEKFDLQGITPQEMKEASQNIEVGFSSVFVKDPPSHPLVQEMLKLWRHWRSTIDFSKYTAGLIHGDMGPGANMLLTNGKVTGLVDFIEVGFGYYIQDVGSFALYAELYRKERQEIYKRFKQAYLQTAPIGEEEFELFEFFVLWRFLLQALYFGWRLDTGYTQGVKSDEGNKKGFDDALQYLGYFKEVYSDHISEF